MSDNDQEMKARWLEKKKGELVIAQLIVKSCKRDVRRSVLRMRQTKMQKERTESKSQEALAKLQVRIKEAKREAKMALGVAKLEMEATERAVISAESRLDQARTEVKRAKAAI